MIMIKSHHNLHKLVSGERKRTRKKCLRCDAEAFDFGVCKVRDHESTDPSLCVIWLVIFRINEITIFRT